MWQCLLVGSLLTWTEKASIDEAFADLTPMAIERLIERHPYLNAVPQDAPEGLDSILPPAPPIDWSRAGNVFPITGDGDGTGDGDPDPRSDDALSDAGEARREEASWEDWALCMGAEIMAEIRGEVWKRMHYTCSAVSISYSVSIVPLTIRASLTAKLWPRCVETWRCRTRAEIELCSAWKKPNNQTVLRQAAAPAFLRDMDFTDIRFLGGKLGSAIATEYGAKTVGDMLDVSLEEMQKRFGEESIWVYNILRGIDHTEVKERVATKSMLASKNTNPHVKTPAQGTHWLGVLAGELNVRLRESRELAPGLWPKTLVLSYRTGGEPSRSRQIPFPFTRNLSTEYIMRFARKLWEEVHVPMMKSGGMRLNNMALSFTGLERLEEGQQGIEGFFANQPALRTAGDPVVDQPKRSRSSSPSATPNVTLPSPKKPRLATLHAGKRKTALDTFLAQDGSVPLAAAAQNETPPEADLSSPIEDSSSQWTCPKCRTVFVPDEVEDEAERARSLEAQKQEHGDYHFALDLQNGGGPSPAVDRVNGNNKGRPAPKAKRKPEGIKAFFVKSSK